MVVGNFSHMDWNGPIISVVANVLTQVVAAEVKTITSQSSALDANSLRHFLPHGMAVVCLFLILISYFILAILI